MTAAERDGAFDIDPELGEKYYKGDRNLEQQLADEITEIIRQFISRRFDEGRLPALRDAHAKDNGCVRAVFRVDPDVAADLRHGVFSRLGQEFDAWIRFSNGNSEVLSSRVPDARGMAVKLMGVDGPKLLDDEKETQDLVMANNPGFFVDDLQRYKDSLVKFHAGGYLRQFSALFSLKLREMLRVFQVNGTLSTNPLHDRYWSMTAFRLGAPPGRMMASKFLVKPRLEKPGWLPRVATYFAPGFSLRHEMEKVLADKQVVFDFYVQRYVDERTPVEDTLTEWKEAVSKPEHVATITIPPQQLNTPQRNALCENLSFSPWHCLAEHKPLGTVNRVRKSIYLEMSEHRHRLNRVPRAEPRGEDPA